MLIPSVRFDLPFTCVDANGNPVVPTGTPTAVLVKNGVDQVTPVAITVTGARGVASCTTPADSVAGDRFFIRVTATINGFVYEVSGPSDSIESPQTLTPAYDAAKSAAAPGAAMSLTAGERVTLAAAIETGFLDDLSGGAFLAGIQSQIQSILDSNTDVPVATLAAVVATAVRASLVDDLAQLAPAEVVSRILVDPTKKLLTNAEGYVTATNGSGGAANTPTFVLPLRSTSPERVEPNRIDLFVRERVPLTIAIYDDKQQPVDCTGLTCTLFVASGIEIPQLVPTAATSGGLRNLYSFTPPAEMTAGVGTHWFGLRVSDATERVLAFGHVVVAELP